MGLIRHHSHWPLLFALIIKLEWQVTLLVYSDTKTLLSLLRLLVCDCMAFQSQ